MKLEEALGMAQTPCAVSMAKAKARLNGMAKPLGSLGLLEKALVQLAGIQRTDRVSIDKKCTVVMCADNGIVDRGVTQSGQEVTAIVTENLSRGETTVCHMSRIAGSYVLPVDVGVARDLQGEKILHRKIAYGTKDFTEIPAMSRKQAVKAIETGIDIAIDLKEKGCTLLATGEMGIGNTTTSAAVASVLLGVPAEEVTGRGSGLSTEGLGRKIEVIKTGVKLHRPDPIDPIDVLAKVGGFDIAALCGLYIGASAAGIGVVMDGVISGVAALCAVRLCPTTRGYMLPSHLSAEPAGKLVSEALEAEPFIMAHMRLGEGTGAVAAFAVFDLIMEVYNRMCSFEETNIEHYVPLV